jgi:hypothetical protein
MDLFGLKKSKDFPMAEGHGYPLVLIRTLARLPMSSSSQCLYEVDDATASGANHAASALIASPSESECSGECREAGASDPVCPVVCQISLSPTISPLTMCTNVSRPSSLRVLLSGFLGSLVPPQESFAVLQLLESIPSSQRRCISCLFPSKYI